jgi:hypothetical protein
LRDLVVDGRLITEEDFRGAVKEFEVDPVALFLFSVNTGVLPSNCKLLSQ